MNDAARILRIVHPIGEASAATDFCRAIARVTPDWEIRTDGGTVSFHDPEREGEEHPRWVAVIVGEPKDSDLVVRPGPLIRAFSRGVETRIQMPNLVDGVDIRGTVAALQALDALPSEPIGG